MLPNSLIVKSGCRRQEVQNRRLLLCAQLAGISVVNDGDALVIHHDIARMEVSMEETGIEKRLIQPFAGQIDQILLLRLQFLSKGGQLFHRLVDIYL